MRALRRHVRVRAAQPSGTMLVLYGEENEDLEDEGAPEEPEVQVIFPLEINFPGGSRMGGDGIFFILRAYRWRPRVGAGFESD